MADDLSENTQKFLTPKECPLLQRACNPEHCAWGHRGRCVVLDLVNAIRNLEG